MIIMTLKEYMEREISIILERHKYIVKRTNSALEALSALDFENARYQVEIAHCASLNGKDIVKITDGSLKKAIKEAESEFLKNNLNRASHGRITVFVTIGEATYPIPRRYWGEYVSANKE